MKKQDKINQNVKRVGNEMMKEIDEPDFAESFEPNCFVDEENDQVKRRDRVERFNNEMERKEKMNNFSASHTSNSVECDNRKIAFLKKKLGQLIEKTECIISAFNMAKYNNLPGANDPEFHEWICETIIGHTRELAKVDERRLSTDRDSCILRLSNDITEGRGAFPGCQSVDQLYQRYLNDKKHWQMTEFCKDIFAKTMKHDIERIKCEKNVEKL